ncbi:MAG: gas vesicle protein [Methanoregula sp.]|nr:gas vesicle protein [Methanoregula sp.]
MMEKQVQQQTKMPGKANTKQVREIKRPGKLNMQQVLANVKKEMVELTSLPFNTIVSVTRDEETKGPTVTVELVERKAIPDSMDLLGMYEVSTDEEGRILDFRRVGMRKRGDAAGATEY